MSSEIVHVLKKILRISTIQEKMLVCKWEFIKPVGIGKYLLSSVCSLTNFGNKEGLSAFTNYKIF